MKHYSTITELYSTPDKLADRLEKLGACDPSLRWAENFDSDEAAWSECHRGDWMLWLWAKTIPPNDADSRRPLVLCACECARLSLHRYESRYPGDRRVRTCLETAERWARGEASLEEVKVAADAAADAASYAASYEASAASNDILSQCADIVRRHHPEPPVISGVA